MSDRKMTLAIKGMSCEHCEGRVSDALNGVEGVSDVKVDHETDEATLQAADHVSHETLAKAVDDAGFEVVSG